MPHKTILRTKLFRPNTPADFVDRLELFERLRNSVNCRLILVSAAAGYGKSVTTRSLGSNGTENRVKDLDRELDDHVLGVLRLVQHTDIGQRVWCPNPLNTGGESKASFPRELKFFIFGMERPYELWRHERRDSFWLETKRKAG